MPNDTILSMDSAIYKHLYSLFGYQIKHESTLVRGYLASNGAYERTDDVASALGGPCPISKIVSFNAIDFRWSIGNHLLSVSVAQEVNREINIFELLEIISMYSFVKATNLEF